MKTIGLIGGMSWESTAVYYDLINRFVKERLGGYHSAACLLYSFDFFEIERLQRVDGWDKLDRLMVGAASRLKNAGADFLVICANTMHRSAPVIEGETGMEVLDIAEAAGQGGGETGPRPRGPPGDQVHDGGRFRPGIVKGTVRTRRDDTGRGGPGVVHAVIYDELCMGVLKDESRRFHRRRQLAAGARRPGRRPGVHRDPAPHGRGRRGHSRLRHHAHPRGGRGEKACG